MFTHSTESEDAYERYNQSKTKTMNKNGSKAAFPRPYSHDERPSGGFEGDHPQSFQALDGFTKREVIAKDLMVGILSSKGGGNMKEAAKMAIEATDALLFELENHK